MPPYTSVVSLEKPPDKSRDEQTAIFSQYNREKEAKTPLLNYYDPPYQRFNWMPDNILRDLSRIADGVLARLSNFRLSRELCLTRPDYLQAEPGCSTYRESSIFQLVRLGEPGPPPQTQAHLFASH